MRSVESSRESIPKITLRDVVRASYVEAVYKKGLPRHVDFDRALQDDIKNGNDAKAVSEVVERFLGCNDKARCSAEDKELCNEIEAAVLEYKLGNHSETKH